MSSAFRVQLSLEHCGEFHVPQITKESAAAGSAVIQENHQVNHIFFNHLRHHNHIGHHIPTVFALGASPSVIRKHFANNKPNQRPPLPVDVDIIQELHDYNAFLKYLDKERYYRDYVMFFQHELDKKGIQEVVNEYVFKRDERADALIVRMFAGLIHPVIQLGFGLEFNQPLIIAEALAETAANDGWIGPYLMATEKAAANTKSPKSLADIVDQISVDDDLRAAAVWEEGSVRRDGILGQTPKAMIQYAAQWTVGVEELEYKTAEMNNTAAYFAGGAQHPPKCIKYDFYYLHCVTCSIFFTTFLKQPWISKENKARILQFKGWFDLALYASRRAAPPLLNEITGYRPKQAEGWDNIITRAVEHEDDGHLSKLVRALRHGQEICRPYDHDPGFRIKDGMWLQLGHMAVDSWEAKGAGEPFVRNAGFDEAWDKVEDRPRAQL